jgi:hypothetical protein
MDYTEAQAISDNGFDDVLHSQVYDNVPLLIKLKDMKQVQSGGGGRQWTWTIRIAKFGKANAVDPRADITYVAKETRTEVLDTPKYYLVSNILPWDKLRENKGKAQKIDLIADATKELKEDMDDRIGTDLYTANPNGNGITPLSTIVDSTATYAGLAYNDAAIDTGSWNSIEDSATTKLELYGGVYGTSTNNSLSSMVNAATFGKNGPGFHLTTKDLKSVFEAALEAQKIYQVNAKLGDKTMANAGFDSVLFKGSPVVADPYCPAGSWYGLDLDAFFLLYDPDFYFKPTKWEKLGSEQEYALKKNLATVIQMKCDRRRTSFKFTALDAEQV